MPSPEPLRSIDNDDEDGGTVALKVLEAELSAKLDQSIEDLGRLTDDQASETSRGAYVDTTTTTNTVRNPSTNIGGGGAEDGDGNNDDDESSLDGEVGNLADLATEELARELRELDRVLSDQTSGGDTGGGSYTKQKTANKSAPFQGTGRRARARRARIRREMEAREERAKAMNAMNVGVGGDIGGKKEPPQSSGSTSLSRLLAAQEAKASSRYRYDHKQGYGFGQRDEYYNEVDKWSRAKMDENKKKPPPAVGKPFEGKGRRARARRARERKAAEDATMERSQISDDAPANAPANNTEEECVQDKEETGGAVSGILKDTSKSFPDFTIRDALP